MGNLLGISTDKAESIASKMIMDDRMSGSIDQIDGMIYFEHSTGSIETWDHQIEKLCKRVSEIVSEIEQVTKV